ncbi:MAG: NAD(P)-dependent oxidoreductase, partial [Candidatus Limnocylindrales bacterium]
MPETRVGFCGLGTMGAAMAANVARAGYPLTVWNRTPGKASPAVAEGAVESGTPSALGAAAEVVIICVSDTPDVEAVLFGPDGLAGGLAAGALVIDCSTIAPGATRGFARRLAEQGVGFVDAPVSGGSEGALNGTLTIMVGGAPEDVER